MDERELADLSAAKASLPDWWTGAESDVVSHLSHLMGEALVLDPARVAVASFGPRLTHADDAVELANAVPHFVLWLHRYFRALEELLNEREIFLHDPTLGETL